MSETVEMDFVQSEPLEINIDTKDSLDLEFNANTGTSNYEALSNKPQINGVVLIGNKTSKDIKVQDEMKRITEHQIDQIVFGI